MRQYVTHLSDIRRFSHPVLCHPHGKGLLQVQEDAGGEGEKEASESDDEPQPKKKRKKGKSGKVTGKQKHRDASFFAGLLKQE